MYGWIWRHLPFGLPGKLIGSIGLVAATGALLWYVIFPWAEPLLPFDDVQVTQNGVVPTDPAASQSPGVRRGPSGAPSGDFDIPYATQSDNSVPSATASR